MGDSKLDAMWSWGLLGLVLLAVEMATGTFYVLWFGVAALIVSIITWLMPAISVSIQLLFFSIFSLGSLFVWQRFYKKSGHDLRIGQSQGDEIGRSGIIIEAVDPLQTGRIQFNQGVMGSREWAVVSDEKIDAGSEAMIVAVEGNTLRVKPK